MILTATTKLRESLISQFPIPERDSHIYSSIEEAVEDALRRAFKDINFRTMTANKKNNAIKKILESINGAQKIKKFNLLAITDQDIKENIQNLIERLTTKAVAYEDCRITEYLIVCLLKNGFVNNFVDYFNSSFKSDVTFDNWHNKTASLFLDVLVAYYDNARYGKAQKIVNMIFKHLYCMQFSTEQNQKVLHDDYFTHCHMPLDSFTLSWLYRKDGTKVCEWSNLVYENKEDNTVSYLDYLKRVRSLFPINTLTAFQAEFYIWPQMQITEALETFFRIEHEKSDVDSFVKLELDDKCSIIAKEIGTKIFAQKFI